jgi:hypothetical protein
MPLLQALVKVNGLNVREGPSTQYAPPRTKVQAGAALIVLGQALDQQWILVRLPDGSVGWVSAEPQHVTLSVPLASLPPAYYRPFNGVVQQVGKQNGMGQLTIENQREEDHVVVLTPNNDPFLAIYVRAGETVKIDKIPDGIYSVFSTSGTEWDGRGFHNQTSPWIKQYEPFTFTTYTKDHTLWFTDLTYTLSREVSSTPTGFTGVQPPPIRTTNSTKE